MSLEKIPIFSLVSVSLYRKRNNKAKAFLLNWTAQNVSSFPFKLWQNFRNPLPRFSLSNFLSISYRHMPNLPSNGTSKSIDTGETTCRVAGFFTSFFAVCKLFVVFSYSVFSTLSKCEGKLTPLDSFTSFLLSKLMQYSINGGEMRSWGVPLSGGRCILHFVYVHTMLGSYLSLASTHLRLILTTWTIYSHFPKHYKTIII